MPSGRLERLPPEALRPQSGMDHEDASRCGRVGRSGTAQSERPHQGSPMRPLLCFASALLGMAFAPVLAEDSSPAGGKVRIIVFGAHPDDAEYKAGGTAAKWAKLGHKVKLCSVTNGDIGHWREAGGPLAQRRTRE